MKFFHFFLIISITLAECPNSCSGHGQCTADGTCICNKQPGLGINQGDFSSYLYQGVDCSERTCPGDISFGSIPVTPSTSSKKELFSNEYSGTRITISKKTNRFLGEERDLAPTEDDVTVAPSEETTTTTTTPIDEYEPPQKNITKVEIEKPEDKKSEEVYNKLVSNNNFGGILKCTGNGDKVYTVTVYGGDNDTLTVTSDEDIGSETLSCYPTYIRNDLSLYDTIVFNKNKTSFKEISRWYKVGKSMKKYGFITGIDYIVNLACVHNKKNNIIKEEIGIATLNNDGDNITFNYSDSNNIPDFCFLLSLGANGNESENVNNIEMMSSELSTFIGNDKDNNYYYMKHIDYSPVISTSITISVNETSRRRMLFEDGRILADENTLLGKELHHENDNTKMIFAVDFKKDSSSTVSINEIIRSLEVGFKANVVSYTKIDDNKQISGIDQVIITEKPKNVKCDNIENPGTDGKQIEPASGNPTTCYLIYVDTNIDNADSYHIVLSQSGFHPILECSGQGYCNRNTGICECLPGYEGDACQRSSCPNDCSNHGICQEVQKVLSNPKEYPSYFGHESDKPSKLFACKCDKGHRGADCSLLECPSSEDPILKSKGVTDKLDYRDCSGRGICNYNSGLCECFDGYTGVACEIMVSMK